MSSMNESIQTQGDQMIASVYPQLNEPDNPVPASDQPAPGAPAIMVRPEQPKARKDFQIVAGGLDPNTLYNIRVTSPGGQEGAVLATGDDGSVAFSTFAYFDGVYSIAAHAVGSEVALVAVTVNILPTTSL